MKFVFDLDGTLSFDYMTIDEEIKQVLLKAEDYGHHNVLHPLSRLHIRTPLNGRDVLYLINE